MTPDRRMGGEGEVERARDDRSLDEHLALETRLGLDAKGPSRSEPYFDDGGEPRLVNAAVVFLDLLGTAADRSAADALDHLRVTREAIRQAQAWSATGLDKLHDGALYSFSDNIALGFPAHEPLDAATALSYTVVDSAYLQLAFLVHGLFSRGAIAFDLFFADPKLEFVHGPALNRAVHLEKVRAKFPRVALDEAAAAIARADVVADELQGERSAWRDQLLVDPAGTVYVNYLHVLLDELVDEVPSAEAFLPRHRDFIERNLRRFDGVAGVEEKYRWAAGYHNRFVELFAPELLERAPDIRVTCSRPLGSFVRFASDIDEPS